jgi:hypothetical protein
MTLGDRASRACTVFSPFVWHRCGAGSTPAAWAFMERRSGDSDCFSSVGVNAARDRSQSVDAVCNATKHACPWSVPSQRTPIRKPCRDLSYCRWRAGGLACAAHARGRAVRCAIARGHCRGERPMQASLQARARTSALLAHPPQVPATRTTHTHASHARTQTYTRTNTHAHTPRPATTCSQPHLGDFASACCTLHLARTAAALDGRSAQRQVRRKTRLRRRR